MRYRLKRSELYNCSVLFHFMQRLILYSSFYNIIPGIVPTLMNYMSIACLILKCVSEFWQEKFVFKWLVCVIILGPFLWIGSICANSDELLWILIYIITAKNVEPRSIAKTIYAVCGIGTVVIIVCVLIGVIPNNYELAVNSTGKVIVRMYMGFIHCNVFGTFLSTIFLCHFFIRFNRINKLDILFGVMLICISAFVAYSRTNALIMLIGLMCMKFYTVPSRKLIGITMCIMAVTAILSVVLSVNYDSSSTFMVEFNEVLTGRLSAAKEAYDRYGFSIMGQDFQTIFQTNTVAFGESGKQQQVIDNAFMHLLVHYGILPTTVLMWYYFSNAVWLYRTQQLNVLFVMFLSFIQGVSEGNIYSSYNAILFILAATQYRRMSRCKGSINIDE